MVNGMHELHHSPVRSFHDPDAYIDQENVMLCIHGSIRVDLVSVHVPPVTALSTYMPFLTAFPPIFTPFTPPKCIVLLL